MKIIVEAGATKSDWCAIVPGRSPVIVKAGGINLATMSSESIRLVIREAYRTIMEELEGLELSETVREIHFYAAGLIAQKESDGEVPLLAQQLDGELRNLFPQAVIEYASDLLDAARAVCGRNAGIVAIMGTGSNSCFYDGQRIVRNIRSGGFILGDEGGGASLGKMFLSDFIKDLVPEDVADAFRQDFDVDYLTIVQNVYKSDTPAKYLGGFAPWILQRYGTSEYVRSLVEQNFRNFMERSLMHYDIRNFQVGVVGGFAYANREVLRKVAEPYGIRFGRIIATSIEGLVEFHSEA